MSADPLAAAEAIRALRLLACPCCLKLHPFMKVAGGLERPRCPDRQEGETARPLVLATSPDPAIFAYLTNHDSGALRFGALRVPGWIRQLIEPAEADIDSVDDETKET